MTPSATPLPTTMRAVRVHAFDGAPSSLSLDEVPVPQPGPGEVLVRMAACPINPSDVSFVRGLYSAKPTPPITPGFEGAGTVVTAGPGLVGKMQLGRRVACAARPGRDGTWAEYLVTSTKTCWPLPDSVTDEQGAMLIVNPLTALALVGIARQRRARAIVHTAAASALGRMLLRLGQSARLPIIHVVRRQEQVELLRSLGAEHVVDSSAPDFDAELGRLAHALHATLAFDAVAGELTGRVLGAMPSGSHLTLYGGLSYEALAIDPGQIIFGGKSIDGFWLTHHVERQHAVRGMMMLRRATRLLATSLQSPIAQRVALGEVHAGLAAYAESATRGKVLLLPGT